MYYSFFAIYFGIFVSISVLSVFAQKFRLEKLNTKNGKVKEKVPEPDDDVNVTIGTEKSDLKEGEKYEDGLRILEALSATGLRSIRYAKEIPGVKEILANDISSKAVDDINGNIADNNVQHLVRSSLKDATMLMYENKKNQFDAIDLDPYGCPSIFLDSTVQAVKDGGLLLVTATDMAVLAGNSPETCYSKYGAISLKIKSCHEMVTFILIYLVK